MRQRLAGALARHLDQAQLREAVDGEARPVALQRPVELGQHRGPVIGLLHVDEVDDDDAAEVAQPQLLEEVRGQPLDEASRERLAEIYERSIVELSQALSPDLQEELHMLTLPFKEGEIPSESELRVAKAQLVGWLEGLFHGIQATLFAQQIAARQQLEQMRQLPPGMMQERPAQGERPGTYL